MSEPAESINSDVRAILLLVEKIQSEQTSLSLDLSVLQSTLTGLAEDVKRIADTVCGKVLTGIDVKVDPPTPRPLKGKFMVTVKLAKKAQGTTRSAAKKAIRGAAPVAFVLQDNQDDTIQVFGTDAAGDQLDISAVATLAVTSDNTAILTVDPPVGMVATVHGVVPSPLPAPGTTLGTANLLFTATWNDGSVGPFSFTLPCTVSTAPAGAPVGIVVTPGTPTVRP